MLASEYPTSPVRYGRTQPQAQSQMKDTLPVVPNRLQGYDGSHRRESVSAAMKGAFSILLVPSY